VRLYGYSAAEALGQYIAIFMVPPERHNEISQILECVEQGKRIDNHETAWVKKDGTRVDVSLTVFPIRQATGEIMGATSIGRKISECKLADEAFRTLK
jgi:PAS domain S-box-containing protein